MGWSPQEVRDASAAEILTMWAAKHEAARARSRKPEPFKQADLRALMERYPDV